MTNIDIGPGVALPRESVTETFAILANRGKGKSSTARVFVEELYGQGLPVVVLDVKGDWWGLRSDAAGTGPGLPFVIFGGDHADVPLEPSAGALLADLIVDKRIPCVLDLSLMSKTKARSFTVDFAERLYRRNREAIMLVVDEADVLIPQRASAETARLLGAMEDIAKRGRSRGLGLTLITQRPQEVAKSVLDLCETLLLLGMTGPRSIKAIQDWISVNVDEETSAGQVIASLPTLGVGEAWVWSPAFLRLLTRTQVRRIRTFDSHATPRPGERAKTPRMTTEVDLEALGAEIAATVERAKADDPRALRARIRDLEQQVSVKPEPVIERVEVPVLAEELVLRLEQVLTDLQKHGQQAVDVAQDMLDQLRNAQAHLRGRPAPRPVQAPRPRVMDSAPIRPAPTPRQAVEGGGALGKTERAILTVLVIYGERTHRQIALQTGYSPKASTIGVSLSKLRKLGYVEPTAPIRATPEGVEALGDYDPLPTGPALLSFWQGKLGKTENKMLDHLLRCYPNATDVMTTAEATGYSPQASTIGVSMSKLRKLEIAEGWRLSDDFARSIGIS